MIILFLGVLTGSILGFVILSRKQNALESQISEVSRANQKLQKKITEMERDQSHSSAILDNLVEGVIAVNTDKAVLMANPSVQKMFHITAENAAKKSLIELVGDPNIDSMMTQAIESQDVITEEVSFSHLDGKVLKVHAVGISKSSKGVSGLLILDDVTKVRKLEKMRREFVTNVSHELKTPLTSIKGFVETLLGGALDDKENSVSFLKMMQDDTNRLTRLIEDILELSKIESKEIPLNLENLDLAGEVQAALKVLAPQIQEKGIQIENEITTDQKVLVRADPDKVRQVLMNLLDNAIKFNSSKGKIKLRQKVVGDQVEVAIQDTGPGIPEKALGHLFERFFRVDKARSSGLGGTGLGLAIVKHIIEGHKGNVWCKSTLGEGACFYFTLPKA